MKLVKKLIPLVTAASATVIAVPTVLTSCSGSSIKMDNLLLSAKPKFKPLDGVSSFGSYDEATAAYVKFMKANPQYFVQDLKWGVYQNWLAYYDQANYTIDDEQSEGEYFDSTIYQLSFGATEPTFGETKFAMPGEDDLTYNTISFKMKVKVVAEVRTVEPNNPNISYVKTITNETETEYKNMIFFAYPSKIDTRRLNSGDGGHAGEKLSNVVNEDEPDTSKAAWFITISDNTDTQKLYDVYPSSDWGIKYKSTITTQTTTIDATYPGNPEKIITSSTGNYEGDINTATKLNDVIAYKDFTKDETGPAWYNQEAKSIIANSVLLDLVTYYFRDVFLLPEIKAEKALTSGSMPLTPSGEELGPVVFSDEATGTHPEGLRGWTFQSPNLSEAEAGYDIDDVAFVALDENGQEISYISLSETPSSTSNHVGDARTLTLDLEDSYVLWNSLGDGGMTPVSVGAVLDKGFNAGSTTGDEYIYQTNLPLVFTIPSKYKFKAIISFTGGVEDKIIDINLKNKNVYIYASDAPQD